MAGRPRKSDVARTTSGRISRKKSDKLYSVYIAALVRTGWIKVGRTGNVRSRMQAMAVEAGEKPVVCAAVQYQTEVESVIAETVLVRILNSRGYLRKGREYFSVPYETLPELVYQFATVSGGHVAIESFGQHRAHVGVPGEGVRRLLYGHRTHDLTPQ